MRGRPATTSQKEAAFIKQNGKCIKCGQFLLVKQTHHVKYAAKMGLSLTSNLVAVCPNCHQKLHIQEQAIEMDKKIRRDSRNKNKMKRITQEYNQSIFSTINNFMGRIN